MGSKWNSGWDNVLDDYRKAMLEHGDQEKAIAAAFGKIDMTALEESWIAYSKSHITKT